jgi:Tol biopolymer transport system component/tRNA A-37 threonylcarbamoyl transferase component Bud32
VPLSPHTRLGPYEIVSAIGAGGMGEVYKARDTRLDRTVAIKILPEHISAKPQARERFEREARAVSSLNHPHICTLHDIGQQDGIDYLVMEYLEGQTLADRLRKGPLPLEQVLQYAIQITEALDAAHRHGVIHRDLKPGNIMLTKSGVKLLDFGLAKIRAAEAAAGITALPTQTTPLTAEGTILGTLQYMAPEQLEGVEADARTDIFAFGAVIYEMATGRKAFAGKNQASLISAIMTAEPAPISGLQNIAPSALDHIVRTCLAKEPDARWQSSSDIATQLKWIAETVPQALSATAPKHRVWLKWVAVATLFLGSAGGTYWLGVRSPHQFTLPEATLRRLTNDAGLTTGAAISPDGKLVAYASDRADSSNLDIWVQQVDGGGVVRITDDPADDYDPTFSPDGAQIAFRSNREGGGIYVVPALGGQARLLISQGRRPRFSPDGQMLMYSTGSDLFIHRTPGVAPVQIGAGCHVAMESAVWSPDGQRVLFSAACGSHQYSGPFEMWISTLDGKRIAGPRVSPPFYQIDQWLPSPSRLLLTMDVSDGTSIVMVPVSADGTHVTGPWQKLTFGTGAERLASAASNGRIALSSVNSETHIWGVPIDGNAHATGVPKRLTSNLAGGDNSFSLSRDGKNLAFTCYWADRTMLYYRNLATGNEREVSSEVGGGVFSPDATKIMAVGPAPPSEKWLNGIYEMPISGGVPKKIWGDPEAEVSIWDWAPDGATLLYWRGFLGKMHEMNLKSLSKTTFLDDPEYEAWQGHSSNDGRWVTFNGVRDHRYSRVYVAPFRRALVPRADWIAVSDSHWDDKPRFSHDDKLIFFTSDRDGFWCIWAQRLALDMHPAGAPFAVYHSHQSRRSLGNRERGGTEIDVGPNLIVFNQAELTGKIWLLDPAVRSAR